MAQPQTGRSEQAPGTVNPLTREGTFKKRNPAQTAIDITIQAMLRQGAPVRKIAEALNISPSTVNRTKARIRAQNDPGEECPGLLSPRRDELAGKVIDRFLKAGANMKKVKGSDALGAVKLYSERRWPTKRDDAPGPMSFTAVFIHEARIQLPGPASHTTRGISPHQELPDAGHPQSNQILEAEFRDG